MTRADNKGSITMNDVPSSEDRTVATSRPMAGRIALVTGSTSGIGLGIANALAAEGATIVLNGFGDPEEIRTLCHVMGARFGVPVSHADADLSDPAAIDRMMREDLPGPVDILVNNAGVQFVAPVEEFPPEKWNAILAVNLSSAFHCIRAVLPSMKRQRFGRIVNVASAHGLIASRFKSAYVAAKHGVVGLTKTVALETAEHGVTCNAICPGYVWTPLVERQVDGQAAAHGIGRDEVIRRIFLADQPTRRFAAIEEVAATAVFLCGPLAASITGIALPVDGGWTAH